MVHGASWEEAQEGPGPENPITPSTHTQDVTRIISGCKAGIHGLHNVYIPAMRKEWAVKVKDMTRKDLKKDLRYWKVPVPPLLDEMLEEAVRRGASVTKADFIRIAVIERLEKLGLTERGALDQPMRGGDE